MKLDNSLKTYTCNSECDVESSSWCFLRRFSTFSKLGELQIVIEDEAIK